MNPFRILDIDHNASTKDILRAVARAMRERSHNARVLAQAQKQLMNPVSRAVQEFIHIMDVSPLLEPMDVKMPPGLDRNDFFQGMCLDVFSEES
ncbi:MAG: hypothetical protein JRH15_11930 [Deltaproteobacteria bacterium]|nr:hypothetical protein [Deltaproteobacteria bacterium]